MDRENDEQGASADADRAASPSDLSPASGSSQSSIPSADIAFARWFLKDEGYSLRCERFGEECGIEDGPEWRIARGWIRAAFQAGFDAAQGIEARRAETAGLGRNDESAVAKPCAQPEAE